MKAKILLGFAAGVALTSGVFYVASRQVSPVAQVQPAPMPTAPMTVSTAEPKITSPVENPAPVVTPSAPEPPSKPKSEGRKTKPSAVVARRRTIKHPAVEVAQNEIPSEPVQPQQQGSNASSEASNSAASASQPASANTTPPVPAEAPPPAPAPVEQPSAAPAAPHSVTMAAGTVLTVRLGQAISSEQNIAGDTFIATLDQPLVIDGFVIAERGSRVEGRVVEVERAGRVKGVAHVSIELTNLHTSDGQHIHIQTSTFQRDGSKSTGEDAAKVGAGAAIGAIIGALAGGGKGAGIGAGVGGAAGAGTVAATRGKPALIPVETRISFRVRQPLTITEQLH